MVTFAAAGPGLAGVLRRQAARALSGVSLALRAGLATGARVEGQPGAGISAVQPRGSVQPPEGRPAVAARR